MKKRCSLCKQCGKTFDDAKMKYVSYPAQMMIPALNTYNKEYTLDKTTRLINKQFKTQVSTDTIHQWIEKNRDISPHIAP